MFPKKARHERFEVGREFNFFFFFKFFFLKLFVCMCGVYLWICLYHNTLVQFWTQFSRGSSLLHHGFGDQTQLASSLWQVPCTHWTLSIALHFVFQPVSHTHSTGYLLLDVSHTHSTGYPSLNMCMSLHTWTPGLILSFSPFVLSWKLLFLVSSKFWGRGQGFLVIKIPPPCSSFSKL